MKIKICGITSLEEIEYINKLKPEYIGFVFTKSKREITERQAKNLSKKLSKEVKIVGVFKNNSLEEIRVVIKEIKVDVIQLHGKEDNYFIENLREIIKEEYSEKSVQEIKEKYSGESVQEIKEEYGGKSIEEIKEWNKDKKSGKIQIWKGISIKSEEDLKRDINLKVDNFILDGGNPGSGETFNWDLIKQTNINFNFFLAGGINLENLDGIIKNINPYGVDVSSGVEILDHLGNRRKDFGKMKSLIEKGRK